MASNPIQKKIRNAALIGALITLVIMSIVVAFLLIQLDNATKEQKQIQESYRSVYTISQDVKSGQIITQDMLQMSIAQIQHIPNNATSTLETFMNYSLTDDEGKQVLSDERGAFLSRDCEYMEIYQDDEGYYTYLNNGQKEKVKDIKEYDIYDDEVTGEKQQYIIKKVSKKTRLYKDTETNEYYILVMSGKKRVKQTVRIFGTPLIAKVNMNKNTVLTLDLISKGTPVLDDIRKQEYNVIVLPADLTTGDYVDIRVQFPNGQDFIVISKKMVEIPIIDGMLSEQTIWLNLSEDEILSMSCAIVEAYRINGTKIYAAKYTEPGRQDAAIPTYPLNAETVALIQSDPNVTQTAENSLKERYTEALINIRNNTINKELEKSQNSESNVPGKMNESIVKSKEERKQYLESLANSAY